MNFYDNKDVFWIHFSSQEDWSGFSSLVLLNLASNGVLWHLQYLNLFPPFVFLFRDMIHIIGTIYVELERTL